MRNQTMNLYQKVEPSLLKLRQRLAKEGIYSLANMDYEKYLRTVFWKEVKEWVLERDDNKCVICGVAKSRSCDLEVHHRSYDLEVLEGKNDEMLVSLCPRCHKLIEFYSDGRKRFSLPEKEKQYHELGLIHAEVESNGLSIKISKTSKKGSDSFELSYVGDSNYLLFYSIEFLMYGFVLNVYCRHRSETKIPLPFDRYKLYQKSGVKISNKTTGKELIGVKITNNEAVIKVSRSCVYPVYKYLSSYISEKAYWHVVQ